MILGIFIGILLSYLILFFVPNMFWCWKWLRWYIFKPNNIWDTLKESFLEFIGINRM